jgi:hypothetical protein
MENTTLTIDSFAQRLGISRSTVYSWLTDGILIVGVHYIHINRVVRIFWNEALVLHLMQVSMQQNNTKPTTRLHRNGKGGKNKVAINIEYLE